MQLIDEIQKTIPVLDNHQLIFIMTWCIKELNERKYNKQTLKTITTNMIDEKGIKL